MSRDPSLTTRFDSLLTQSHAQGFFNEVTGLGTARDKSVYTQYNPTFVPLDAQTLSALYHGHDLAARVVDVIPDEELRLDFTIETPGNEQAETLLREEFKRLGVRQNALDGRTYGRAFGGAATIVGAEDGRAAYEPLDTRRVRQIDWLRTVDRRYLWPNTWYTRGPKNGQVETYYLNDAHPGGSESFVIHESRLILWPGARTAQQEKDRNNSWDHSVLDRCWPALKAFETIYKGVELLVTDGPQAVYKVKGLFDKIVAGEENALRTRFELIDMYRSMMRAIIIDADGSESFERQQVTYSGTPEILNQMQLRLSAATQIPMLVLFGQAPGGLGVTGENDLKWFFDRTASSQRNVLAPRLEQVARLILTIARITVPEVVVSFPNLWTPSAKEQAEERFIQAQTDEKYISNNVLTPEEVLLSRFKDKGRWSPEWSAVDRGVREKTLKDVLKALADGGPEEPTDPEDPAPEPETRQDYSPDQARDENGRWTITGKKTLFRAANDDYLSQGYSFAETLETAESYRDNPGFGGDKLFRVKAEGNVLDLRGRSVDEVAEHFGVSNPGAIGIDEWVPREQKILEGALIEGVDWIQVNESYPAGTTTWIWTGNSEKEPELVALSSRSNREAARLP